MVTFYLKIREKEIIEKASFESYGCAANIATSGIITEMVKELSLEASWKDINWEKVTEEVGGLPNIKFHYEILAVGALEREIWLCFEKRVQSQVGCLRNTLLKSRKRWRKKNWQSPYLSG
jgi:nitrogen fixation NifU-like protein